MDGPLIDFTHQPLTVMIPTTSTETELERCLVLLRCQLGHELEYRSVEYLCCGESRLCS